MHLYLANKESCGCSCWTADTITIASLLIISHMSINTQKLIKFAISSDYTTTWMMTMTKVYLLDCWMRLLMSDGVVEETIRTCHHLIAVIGRLLM